MSNLARVDSVEHMPVDMSESATLLSIIQRAAADPQCDIEKMERLMAMHEKMQDRKALAEFNKAMAEMQCDIPSVAERGLNTHTNNGYATLEDIVGVVKPIMKEHGFAISFKVDHTGAGMAVTGILMHRDGHREQTTMLLPIDEGKGRSAVQAAGSSVTYGKRYVMCALLNITTRGEDNDGLAAVPTANVTPPQASAINALLARCSAKTNDWFVDEYGSAECVPKSRHDVLVSQLNKAIKAAEAAAVAA
jgi:hypothetical protein